MAEALGHDGIPDLIVANEGSNDVSLLLGQGQGSSWTLKAGPRLQAGGVGPVATTVADITGPRGVPDGIPDLVVTNSQSNRVALLPGVGGGFFNDRSPQTFATGLDPRQAFVGNFDGRPGLVTINAGSNDLTFFPEFWPGREHRQWRRQSRGGAALGLQRRRSERPGGGQQRQWPVCTVRGDRKRTEPGQRLFSRQRPASHGAGHVGRRRCGAVICQRSGAGVGHSADVVWHPRAVSRRERTTSAAFRCLVGERAWYCGRTGYHLYPHRDCCRGWARR